VALLAGKGIRIMCCCFADFCWLLVYLSTVTNFPFCRCFMRRNAASVQRADILSYNKHKCSMQCKLASEGAPVFQPQQCVTEHTNVHFILKRSLI
jgi:hypothetical protein